MANEGLGWDSLLNMKQSWWSLVLGRGDSPKDISVSLIVYCEFPLTMGKTFRPQMFLVP